jgi:excisionase family DNA binding protein
MRRGDGRRLTPRELADLSEMSADKIRGLLDSGYLKGVRVPNGAGFQWRIPYDEARRWLRELRFI